eukprot:gene11020-2003_t
MPKKRTRGEAVAQDLPAGWELQGTLAVYTHPKCCSASKVAAFDYDHTLAIPRSGGKFASGADDWQVMLPETVPKLKALHQEGYKLVMFTNQAGVEKGKESLDKLLQRLTGFMDHTEVPWQCFVATATDHWRKPFTCMWDHMAVSCAMQINLASCVYVGDAAGPELSVSSKLPCGETCFCAGRVAGWSPGCKKDFSSSDRKFAANIGCEYGPILAAPGTCFSPLICQQRSGEPGLWTQDSCQPEHAQQHQELVVLVGLPASGKSTFTKRHFEPYGYVRVNQDICKTRQACIAMTEKLIASGPVTRGMADKQPVNTARVHQDPGRSVVVDNTNPDPQIRKLYVNIAKEHKVPVRAHHLATPEEVAKHMNQFRMMDTNGAVRRVPAVGFNVFKSKYVPVSKDEGFDQVTEVPFRVLCDSDAAKRKFCMWTEAD